MADRGDIEPVVAADAGRRVVLVAIAIPLFAIAAITLALSTIDASPRMLFADPAAFVGEPFYLGMFSALSVMAWTTGASFASIGAMLAKGRARQSFAALSGLGVWLALDDQFMLHESVGPSIGIPQQAFFATYAGAVLAIAIGFRRLILRGSLLLAIAALSMLALSVAIDMMSDRSIYFAAPSLIVVEDGAKWIGAMLWAAWIASLVLRLVRLPLARIEPPA